GAALLFITDLLRTRRWPYGSIGLATSTVRVGVSLFQTPAGVVIDRVRAHRALASIVTLSLGVCYGLIGFVPGRTAWPVALLFGAGVSQAFVAPLLAALALDLAGHAGFPRMLGRNQAWNHAGSIAAGVGTLLLAHFVGVGAIFVAILGVTVVAAAAPLLIRRE